MSICPREAAAISCRPPKGRGRSHPRPTMVVPRTLARTSHQKALRPPPPVRNTWAGWASPVERKQCLREKATPPQGRLAQGRHASSRWSAHERRPLPAGPRKALARRQDRAGRGGRCRRAGAGGGETRESGGHLASITRCGKVGIDRQEPVVGLRAGERGHDPDEAVGVGMGQVAPTGSPAKARAPSRC